MGNEYSLDIILVFISSILSPESFPCITSWWMAAIVMSQIDTSKLRSIYIVYNWCLQSYFIFHGLLNLSAHSDNWKVVSWGNTLRFTYLYQLLFNIFYSEISWCTFLAIMRYYCNFIKHFILKFNSYNYNCGRNF